MSPRDKVTLFEKELSYIHDSHLEAFAEVCLMDAPEYFFHIPASSTGKYHPQYAMGEGGLVRHVKAAIGIFHELCKADIDMYYYHEYYLLGDKLSSIDRDQLQDEVLIALLLHDIMKHGYAEGHTIHEHPLYAAQFFEHEAKEYGLSPSVTQRISSMIASHMGKWNLSQYSSIALPTPESGLWGNKLVHLCDYLASRKCLEYQFDVVDEA